jgi:phage-related protein
MPETPLKPLYWVASSLKDLKAFPDDVREEIGFALYLAQRGEKHAKAKALKGFGGASTLEVVEDHDGDTFRAVYTVKFAGEIYVLHAFQKKSVKGAKTPQPDMDLIRKRLQAVEAQTKGKS